MTFKEVLHKFRTQSFTEKEKGTKFERLMQRWLQTDPRYNNLTEVWLWEEFPSRKDFGGNDMGIDLVAKTELGDYWAIQCKCYAESTVMDKPAVDSFLATSSRTFHNEVTFQTTRFAARIWISTTNNWGPNAEEALQNQDPPVSRISLVDLNTSPVDWNKLLLGIEGEDALAEGKQPYEHQLRAVSKAYNHYVTQGNDRGKLIMACGTGKTYTSLKIAETLLDNHGLVLFMVPSIALLGQTLNAWSADAQKQIKAICICSDSRASRKMQNADITSDSAVDLALPASTNPKSVANQLLAYRKHDGLVVVFSTYQSIDAVTSAQQAILDYTNGEYGVFDMIICDEAHRTTGVKISTADESNFIKIHSDENVRGKRRLYMTATPRLYGESAKIKASQKDCVLCSMDDPKIYGTEFDRVNFSYAVSNGLLTDYKVLVLTVNEEDIPDNILNDIKDSTNTELNYDDTSKLIGVISGLSKIIRGDHGKTWDNDPRMMHRAVAFCSSIGDDFRPGTSKNVASLLPKVSAKYDETLSDEERSHVVSIAARHVDGSMNSSQRNADLAWLAEESDNPRECRVITNVRCLSEGVDVPSLDAVLFLSARNSQVDVVQSVGRVMRNFRKGEPDQKRYGYIIIPIVVPSSVSAEEALNNNQAFDVVWSILNALRSHDDRFNAIVQKISLNKSKPEMLTMGGVGIGKNALDNGQDTEDAKTLESAEIAKQLEIKFGELQEGMYAKLVEKCGDRLYWENWSKEVGKIAVKFIDRITRLIQTEKYKKQFEDYLKGLQKNLNPSVDQAQAIEMLAQHMITQPIFDALFKDYNFVENNAVSRSMQSMIDLLKDEAFEKDTELLNGFYESVKMNIGEIDNLEGKQTIIKNIYEKFFKGAFPKTVEKLGIVYTPVECVDFIIHSVDRILRDEFNSSLTNENVHILDPFTGTGTFITRLLQSGLIKPEDMERKYLHEIHCNEIVLLAYYIADVNIESVFHELTRRKEYLNYDGICLTDTFQLTEPSHNDLFTEYFRENSEIRDRLRDIPIRVIIGNPPYSAKQKSANDNAQNLAYPVLDKRLSETYATADVSNKNQLYDSYIKAFRWASDRIPKDEGGIVGFISNGAWIDGIGHVGLRRCLENEFTSIYVLNLRGNQRTSGELSRKEGGKIFGGGSRAPIAITFLVKNPAKSGKATIYYHDIGDYLSREQKLKMVRDFRSIKSKKLDWQIIVPNDKGDWVNQRDGVFDNLIPLFPEKKFDTNAESVFVAYSLGTATARDAWVYNYGREELIANMKKTIAFFNQQSELIKSDQNNEVSRDSSKISWNDSLLALCKKGHQISLHQEDISIGLYRPFNKINLYFERTWIQRPYQLPKLYPNNRETNISICVPGISGNKPFSALISSIIPDLNTLSAGSQCFPLYYYEENKNKVGSLFDLGNEEYIRRDGITDWILKEIRSRYGGSRSITKELIFYYVYGILHSQDYRERFASDLKKSLPRIPIVDRVEDFIAFSNAGKQLADLHLNYDKFDGNANEFPDYVTVEEISRPDPNSPEAFDYYAVEKDIKMQFAKVRDEKGKLVADKSTIIFNPRITVRNIPAEAYDYIVNGKSAIEWIIERYAITVDKASQIKNDPNDWAREHHHPSYILDLLLSVIDLSVKTVNIVNNLPHLTCIGFIESESDYPDFLSLYNKIKQQDDESIYAIIEKEIKGTGFTLFEIKSSSPSVEFRGLNLEYWTNDRFDPTLVIKPEDYTSLIDICKEYISEYRSEIFDLLKKKPNTSETVLDIVNLVAPAVAQAYAGIPALAIVGTITIIGRKIIMNFIKRNL